MRSISEIERKVTKKIRTKFKKGSTIRHIDEVDIIPTLRCNLNCVMCHQREIKCKPNMSLDNFKTTILKLKRAGVTKVSLVGGEIFIMPDIFEFIYELEKNKINYDLATNAVLLDDKKISKLKKLKHLEKITTSIDGNQFLHNKIRRNPLAFQKTTENIRKIIDTGLRINIGCVVQKANFQDLEKIFDMLCDFGARDISFLIENYITPKEKREGEIIIEKITGKKPEIFTSTLQNPLGRLNDEDYLKLKKVFEKIRKTAKKRKVSLGLPIQLTHPEVLQENLKKYTCSIFLGYNFQIYFNGGLAFCPFISLGEEFNLSSLPAMKIINSPEYLRLRKSFAKNGALDICRRCCALTKK